MTAPSAAAILLAILLGMAPPATAQFGNLPFFGQPPPSSSSRHSLPRRPVNPRHRRRHPPPARTSFSALDSAAFSAA